MTDQRATLPMTSKWDPEKLRMEEASLRELETKPFFRRIRGYVKLTGPAWLQSAMTLGAGSAAASVMAGVSFGYKLLWVQPLAMLLGVVMFIALGNIVLSTGERPYRSFSRELHPAVAFLWALGTVVASIIWHFPQYGLAGAAAWDLVSLTGVSENSLLVPYIVKFAVGFLILGINIFTTWNYGSGTKGIKLYEEFLKWMIRIVIAAFLIVVIKTGINWNALLRGFFAFEVPQIKGTAPVILGAVGAAVGINMTFLYSYSLLAKGWGKHHKRLARFDLLNSMFLPYLIATSLIIIAMANTIYDPQLGAVRMDLKPVDAAKSMETVFGLTLGRVLFDLGLMGMTCSAIGTHMVVCGFTVCEMFHLEYTPRRYRIFTLVPSIGIMGVAFGSPMWMPVVASAVCLTMMPIAYIAFFIMNNKRSYLGDAVGRGIRRILLNIALLIAIAGVCIGSAIKIKSAVFDKIFPIDRRINSAP